MHAMTLESGADLICRRIIVHKQNKECVGTTDGRHAPAVLESKPKARCILNSKENNKRNQYTSFQHTNLQRDMIGETHKYNPAKTYKNLQKHANSCKHHQKPAETLRNLKKPPKQSKSLILNNLEPPKS